MYDKSKILGIVFLKKAEPGPLFVYFRPFHMRNTYSTNPMNDKRVDGVLGT